MSKTAIGPERRRAQRSAAEEVIGVPFSGLLEPSSQPTTKCDEKSAQPRSAATEVADREGVRVEAEPPPGEAGNTVRRVGLEPTTRRLRVARAGAALLSVPSYVGAWGSGKSANVGALGCTDGCTAGESRQRTD